MVELREQSISLRWQVQSPEPAARQSDATTALAVRSPRSPRTAGALRRRFKQALPDDATAFGARGQRLRPRQAAVNFNSRPSPRSPTVTGSRVVRGDAGIASTDGGTRTASTSQDPPGKEVVQNEPPADQVRLTEFWCSPNCTAPGTPRRRARR